MGTYSTKREEKLMQAYEDGHSSALDILKDSFGGQIPRELDLVNPPHYDVKFSGMLSQPSFYLSTAWGALKSNWITMGFWLGMHSPMGALSVFAFGAAVKALSTKGYVQTSKPNTIVMNGVWGMARHFNKADGGLADVIAHESSHLLQVNDEKESLSSAFDDNRCNLSTLFNNRSKFVTYLSSECEMQARLFTVVSNAYIQHGRLPTNKYELWACLASQGMTPPDEVLEIAQKNQACAKAFSAFPQAQDYIDNYADKNAVGDLDKVQDSIDDQSNKFALWDKGYSFLYGDLLEIMGDRMGQKRMGHGHNIQLREMFMRAAQENMDGALSMPDTLKRMKKVADMMPADDAMSLMKQVATGFAYKEYNPEAIFIPQGALRAGAALTLGHHPGIGTHKAATALHQVTGTLPYKWLQAQRDIERYNNARDASPQTAVPTTRKRPRREHDTRWNPFGSMSFT